MSLEQFNQILSNVILRDAWVKEGVDIYIDESYINKMEVGLC